MMKKIFPVILVPILLCACDQTLSESSLQTVVSEAIMTSSASENTDDMGENLGPPESNVEEIENQFREANLTLTGQAEVIIALNDELDRIYLLLTPTETEVPSITPSPTRGNTATPEPTETLSSGLLYNQKFVISQGSAPLFTFTNKNKKGAPIMMKTDPVKKLLPGEKIIVDWHQIIGDGGEKYYQIQGTKFFGFYVRVSDVYDYLSQ